MDKYLKYINKSVQVNYINNGITDKRTGIVFTLSPRKMTLLCFDDDYEVYIPIDKIESIKEIKGG